MMMLKNRKALLIVNGKKPSKKLLTRLIRNGYSFIACADGGANSLVKMGIIPDIVIGDMDSISIQNIKLLSKKSELIKIPRQSDTDTEKSIKYLIKKKFDEVIIVGSDGDRLDHLLANISLGMKYSSRIKIKLVYGVNIAEFISNEKKSLGKLSETISLFAFDNVEIITEGLKFKPKKLMFGATDSISNVISNKNNMIVLSRGKILLVRSLESFLTNG
ncbi:MAG: thiamine diphosphokinase [Ignavibacteriaceae bacterium]|nr:thiamine diphosphokinase [Ignavibacteriaceae bacterium]